MPPVEEPSAFVYGLARNFKALEYYRLDAPGVTPVHLLGSIKTSLAGGRPVMFGFAVYPSIAQARSAGDIPVPHAAERVLVDGHERGVGRCLAVRVGHASGGVSRHVPRRIWRRQAVGVRSSDRLKSLSSSVE